MTGARTGRLVLHATDERSWDAVVTAHPDATPFHLAGFLTTAGRLLDLDVHLTVAERDGVVVGAVPLLVRTRGPVAQVNHGLPFPYLGPLLDELTGVDQVLAAVRRHLPPRRLLRMTLELPRPTPGALPGGRGWAPDTSYTSAFVPVAGLDDDALVARLSVSPRKRYRRSLEAGLTAGPATRDEIVGNLSRWSAEVFARQGLPPRWPAEAQLAIYDRLVASGVSHATAVRRDGELLAVDVSLLLHGRLIGWEMGTAAAGREAGAAPVLHVAVMSLARDLGAAELDMLGAPTEGIAHYKRSLGAEFRPRGVVRWSAPVLPLAGQLRRVVRGVPVGALR